MALLTKTNAIQISAAMRADGKMTMEELRLVRTLIHEKVAQGELTLDYR